ncbi:cytochrome c oxidase subunit 7A2, mitochondrial-like [Saccoglossus kowalevskii]|uniref:Cytochrome c oxidase subunit 7A2, mitochondrial-like n=1 Tax=Saccoglossus kowalevskii TaxID=10224 RepID=A0ABM0GVD1_SACKO|nr:PREDICTED: cytochrome c oxidase subunit 7A2, mitochondrial-like [Saccoglossus kowalevskii]
MSYKFNSLAGRLTKSSAFAAYIPQGLKASPVIRAPIVWAQKPTTSQDAEGVKNQVYERQKQFQRNKEIPVHLRGGNVDVILYRITLIGCVFGTFWTIYELAKASFPKSND